MFWQQCSQLISEAVGLVLRKDCLCCGRITGQHLPAAGAAVGGFLCAPCAAKLSTRVLRVTDHCATVPVFSTGSYSGPRKVIIVEAKEHQHRAALVVSGRLLAAGVEHAAGLGLVNDPRRKRPVVLVPAPTRRSAARRRGGDCVATIADYAVQMWYPGSACVVPAVWLEEDCQDSVGLNAEQRWRNINHSIRVNTHMVAMLRMLRKQGAHILIVDDVCTTGATIDHTVKILSAEAVLVEAAVVVAHA